MQPSRNKFPYVIIFAEVNEDLLEDKDRPGAAEDGEGLSSEEAEDAAGDAVAEKRLEDALLAAGDVAQKAAECDGLGDGGLDENIRSVLNREGGSAMCQGVFCSTGLQLGTTRWVGSTFSSHCPLSANQRH